MHWTCANRALRIRRDARERELWGEGEDDLEIHTIHVQHT